MIAEGHRTPSATRAVYRWWRTHPDQVFAVTEETNYPKYQFVTGADAVVDAMTYDEWIYLRDRDTVGNITLHVVRRLLSVRVDWSKK